MRRRSLSLYPRRDLLRASLIVVLLVGAALAFSFHFLQPAPPHHIVLASGVEGGLYHKYALRYQAILARDRVTVEERRTNGAGDNLQLLLDPASGVDVAFMQGGVATFPAADGLVMLQSLYYEPLWVFYRGEQTFTQLNELVGMRVSIGTPGSGTRAFVTPLLEANGITPENATLVPVAAADALRALEAGEIDAALMVGGAQTDAILAALRDPKLKLMSFERADAYARRFAYISKLTLPAGTVDLARDVPAQAMTLIGTEAMLAARDGLHPALINLLTDAAHEIHAGQGYFETAGEFPNTDPVDLRVSPDADRHKRFGPRFLYRYLPFWVAAFVERTIILVLPLLVVLVPIIRLLPDFLRWRMRSRIYRWYGELAHVEREVATRRENPPIADWLRQLDRIERAAKEIQTPMSYASEAYTLREHIALVRRTIDARAAAASS
jgi:TRAP transporter TAXI family solute receptor